MVSTVCPTPSAWPTSSQRGVMEGMYFASTPAKQTSSVLSTDHNTKQFTTLNLPKNSCNCDTNFHTRASPPTHVNRPKSSAATHPSWSRLRYSFSLYVYMAINHGRLTAPQLQLHLVTLHKYIPDMEWSTSAVTVVHLDSSSSYLNENNYGSLVCVRCVCVCVCVCMCMRVWL